MNPMTWRELETQFWKRYLELVKGILLIISSILFLIILMINFPTQHLAQWLGWAAEKLSAWQPIKPEIFEIPTVE